MPVNPFIAGRDELLDMLTQRDLAQRQETERASRQQQIDFNQDIQRRQIEGQESDRAAREAKIQAEAAKAKADAERRLMLIAVVSDPKADPQERSKAALELESLDVSGSMIDKIMNPAAAKPTTRPVVRLNPRTGKMENMGEVDANAHFITEPAPPRAPKPPAGPKDNPLLPRGVKHWIESIAQRGVPLEQARSELSSGWRMQRDAHPNAELGEAGKYLMELYPAGNDPIDATPRLPMGGLAATAPPAPPANLPVGPNGTVKLMAPTGEVGEFPPEVAQALIAKGAKVVQ